MMWQEPNCDMDLEIYKDWLYEFNNNNELRNIDFNSLTSGNWMHWYETSGINSYHNYSIFHNNNLTIYINNGISGYETGQGHEDNEFLYYQNHIMSFLNNGNGAHREMFSELEQALLDGTITGCGIW